MLTVTRIANIFTGERRSWKAHAGSPLPAYFPARFDPRRGLIELRGRRISGAEAAGVVPADGDELVLADLPGEIGTILTVVAILLSVGSAIYSFVARPNAPSFGKRGKEEEKIPQFDGVQTSVGPGRPIPVILGEVRAGGHIIESFTSVKFNVLPDSVTGVSLQPEVNTQVPRSQRLNTRIAWCHGPIESISDIEIDGNPVENIKGIAFQSKRGSLIEAAPYGFAEAKNQRSIDTAVTQAGGAHTERTVAQVDTVEVGLNFTNGLAKINNKGKLRNRDIVVVFSYKKAADVSYTTFKSVTISGATRSPMDFWVRFPNLDQAQYDIRVERTTADNTDPAITDAFTWEFLTEVRSNTRAYPGIAETGFLQIPQEQTRAPANYTARIRGLNDVRIYSSANSYHTSYSRNPAWCFMRLATDPVWGPGRFFTYEDSFVISDFIEWAAHCREMVDNGQGRQEERCHIGLELKQQVAVEEMAEIFSIAGDAEVYLEGDKWRVAINKPQSREMNFNEGNYLADSCIWRFVDTSERANRMVGSFINENSNYQEDKVAITDVEAAVGQTQLTSDVVMRGVNRPSQVARYLNKVINFNRLSDEALELAAGVKAMDLKIGSIVGIATASGSQVIATGRILDVKVDKLSFRIDRGITLSSGTSYALTIIYQDKTSDTLAVSGIFDDFTDWVQVANSLWTQNPLPGDKYVIGVASQTAIQEFRIEDISLAPDLTRTFRATKYTPAIHDITLATEFVNVQRIYSTDAMPEAVQNLTLKSRESQDSGSDSVDVIDVGWTLSSGVVARYDVWFREVGTINWIYAGSSEGSTFTIQSEIDDGSSYQVAVIGVSPRGQRLHLDDATKATITI